MLLTYTLGVQNRSTQDINFLVKGVRLDSVEIKKILDSVLYDEFRTGVWFETVGNCEEIRLILYPLESVISEKLQTVLTRAENNSRSKDFYDIYTILKTKTNKINFDSLRVAVSLTFKYRNTILTKENSLNIANRIYNNKYIKDRWVRYKNKNPYAKDIEFESIMDEIIRLIEMVM